MNLAEYYSARAEIYDEIYERDDPRRQAELEDLKTLVRNTFKARRVLEIACGTGYWTSAVASVAEHVTAVDASEQMLRKARARVQGGNAEFLLDDAFTLEKVNGKFTGAMAFCWFSHVPRKRQQEFLKTLHRKLEPGSPILLVDNSYMEGLGGELLPKDESGDTYKFRSLAGAGKVSVLKNYFSERELKSLFCLLDEKAQLDLDKCFWSVLYKTRANLTF